MQNSGQTFLMMIDKDVCKDIRISMMAEDKRSKESKNRISI